MKKEYRDLLRRADAIFIEAQSDLYDKVSQGVLPRVLPVRSVGVMGDGRGMTAVSSACRRETIDFMTAHCAPAV